MRQGYKAASLCKLHTYRYNSNITLIFDIYIHYDISRWTVCKYKGNDMKDSSCDYVYTCEGSIAVLPPWRYHYCLQNWRHQHSHCSLCISHPLCKHTTISFKTKGIASDYSISDTELNYGFQTKHAMQNKTMLVQGLLNCHSLYVFSKITQHHKYDLSEEISPLSNNGIKPALHIYVTKSYWFKTMFFSIQDSFTSL